MKYLSYRALCDHKNIYPLTRSEWWANGCPSFQTYYEQGRERISFRRNKRGAKS